MITAFIGAGIGAGLAIGGNARVDAIEINGGSVVSDSMFGAGIGSGEGLEFGLSDVGNISIRGGTIDATGGVGCGIGSGAVNGGNSTVGSITIGGGTVTACGWAVAGIGAGAASFGVSSVGKILLLGGFVTANGLETPGIGTAPSDEVGWRGESKISEIDIVNGTVLLIGEPGLSAMSPVAIGGLNDGSQVVIDCRHRGDFCLVASESRLQRGDVAIMSRGKRIFAGEVEDEGLSLYCVYAVSSERESITGNSYLQIGTLGGAGGESILITKVGGTDRKEVAFPNWGVGLLVSLNSTGDYRLALKNGDVALVHDGADVYSVGEGVNYFERVDTKGLSAAAVAGIVIGAILLVVAAVVIVVFVIRPKFFGPRGQQEYEGLNPAPLLVVD
jgi:hypothetical protein